MLKLVPDDLYLSVEAGLYLVLDQVNVHPRLPGSVYRNNSSLIWTVFFTKEIRRVIELLREIKTADHHSYKFILIQQNKFFLNSMQSNY